MKLKSSHRFEQTFIDCIVHIQQY